MKIKLFLSDFQKIIKNIKFGSEVNTHPVFYFESAGKIYFYKPVSFVLYCVELLKKDLPKDVDIDTLKKEFDAIEIPENISQNLKLS